MTRNLLALFALLSGLAVLSGGTISASAAPTPACNACVPASDSDASEQAQKQAERLAKYALRGYKPREEANRVRVPRVLRTPLLMGVERAHE